MAVLVIVRVVAIVCVGLLAGIFLAHRAGPQHALQKLAPSGFVQFQQVVHAHYVRFMPWLGRTALLAALVWLLMIRLQWASIEFWLIAASVCGILAIVAMTQAVNAPLNKQLMTWSIEAPPSNLKELWAPWDRINTIRTFVATGALICETLAASLTAS